MLSSNHPSRFDVLLLGLCLPVRPVVVFPKEEKRGLAFRCLLRLVDYRTWDVNHPLTAKKVLRLLEQGRVVALFPEGRVADTGSLRKIYEVPALVALKAAANVVPIRIESGDNGFDTPPLRAPVVLRLGVPHRIDVQTTVGPRARRASAASQLSRVMELAAFNAHVPKGLFDCFLDAVAREGRRTLIIEDMNEQPKTYGALLKASLAISRWLKARIEGDETVGILLPNLIVSVAVLFALQCLGRISAMLNYTAGAAGVEASLRAARIKTVVTSRNFIAQANLDSLLPALAGVKLLYVEDIKKELSLKDKLWLMCFAIWFPRRVRRNVNPHDPAAVLFTTGSEDRPKGVVLSHANIQSNVLQIRTAIDFNSRDKVLNALPIYHAYSFTAGVWLCVLTGMKLFLYVSPLRYRAIPEIAHRRDATYLYGTSTFLNFYAKHAHPTDFASIRYVISGGEKLGDDVAKLWLDKFGLRIYEGYGATECSPVISLATPFAYKKGAVGRLLPGIEYRLEPVEGIEHGGVLHVRGPTVMLGYLRVEHPGVLEPAESTFGEGWYRTGDVVDIDEDGYVRIIGRVKRFAKIAGEMVSLDQIERVAAAASPNYLHAAVLKLEVAGGESTVLFTTDPQLNRGRLQKAARLIGAHDLAVARNVVRMEAIPLLGNGKTNYLELMKLVSDVRTWSAAIESDDDEAETGASSTRKSSASSSRGVSAAPNHDDE